MNLKEAFRFQNKLGTLMDEAQGIPACAKGLTRDDMLRANLNFGGF